MAFYHQRLRQDEIRLLTLLPGKPKDEIRCTIQIVSLNDLPVFEALSYTWGDVHDTKHITVQGNKHVITSNLDMALRNIVKRRRPRVLWVDALCINQEDIDEKNTQVPLMEKIYSTATGVIAWLGPPLPEVELYARWVQTYIAKSYKTSSLPWLMMDFGAKFSDRVARARDVRRLKVLQGYLEVTNSPYWTRMWTFQECYLAREKPICICGSLVTRIAELDDLLDPAVELLMMVSVRIMKIVESNPAQNIDYDERAVLAEIFKIQSMWSSGKALPAFPLEDNIAGQGMANLLIDTAGRQCSNPLDKVYGLYGLSPAMRSTYPPDYQKSFELVLRQTTAYIVNHENSVRMYSLFGLREAGLDDESFPSWVPDFEQPNLFNPRTLHPRTTFFSPSNMSTDRLDVLHEGGFGYLDSAPAAVVEETLTVLHLSARDLGTCRVALRFADEPLKVLRQVQYLLDAANVSSILDPENRNMAGDSATLTERMTRVCAAHVQESIRFTVPQIIAGFDRVLGMQERGEGIGVRPEEYKDIRNRVEHMCTQAAEGLAGKTLFTTEGGLFGIGVPSINDGDILVLAPEVVVPLHLRPLERVTTDSDGVRGTYRLVGTSYVDGVMSPLSVDPDVAAEVKQLELKVFDIW